MKLGPVYATSKNGKIKEWSAYVTDGGEISKLEVFTGYIDGKKSVSTREVKSKNIGKKNETSSYEQACKDAQSKLTKKKKEGYFDTIEEAQNTEIILPMLAKRYDESGKNIIYPCYVQPKLNGVRCMYNNKYISRKGEEYTLFNHLDKGTKQFNQFLDGEIFHPDWTFQEITKCIKKDHGNTNELQYWIYDIVDTNLDFVDRLKIIQSFFASKDSKCERNKFGFRNYKGLVEVPTYLIKSEEEMWEKHREFTSLGFEGTMLRNVNGKYLLKHRSDDLQKVKDFMDDEFKIVGFKEATGNDAGTIVFICETDEGLTFDVRPKGSRELRREWFENGNNLIGKMLTVKYQNYSDAPSSEYKNGVPVFPVALAVRNYE